MCTVMRERERVLTCVHLEGSENIHVCLVIVYVHICVFVYVCIYMCECVNDREGQTI